MTDARNFVARFTSNTSSFSSGITKMSSEVKQLNTSLTENKRKQGETSKEIKQAEKELQKTETAIKKTGSATKDQKEQLEKLRLTISEGKKHLSELKDEEEKIKVAIAAVNDKIKTQKNAFSQIQTSTKNVISGIKDLTSQFLLLEAAATAAVTGIFEYTHSAASWADELETLRDQTGISTDELQKFMYASDLVDVSVSTMTLSLRRMTQEMQKAKNSPDSNAAGIFKSLGVDVVDKLTGQLRDRQEVFYELIDALKAVGNETERDAMMLEIFGRNAEQLNPLIKGGADIIRTMGEEAEKAGLILDQQTLSSLHKFNDGIDTLKAKGNQLQKITAAEMLPAVQAIITVADDLLYEINQMSQTGELESRAKEIGKMIKAGAESLSKLLEFVWKNKDAIAGLVGAIITFKTALTVTTLVNDLVQGLKALKSAQEGAAAAQAALNVVMEANPVGIVIAAIAALAVGLGIYASSASNAKSETDSFNDSMKSIAESASDSIAKIEAERIVAEKLAAQFDQLRNKAAKTNEEKEKMSAIAEELASKLGMTTSELNAEAKTLEELNRLINDHNKKLAEQAEFQAYQELLTEAVKEREKLIRQLEKGGNSAEWLLEFPEAFDSASKAIEEYTYRIEQWGTVQDNVNESTEKSISQTVKFVPAVRNAYSEVASLSYALQIVSDDTKRFSDAVNKNSQEIKNSTSAMSSLASAYNNLQSGQLIDYNTLLDLIEKYPEYSSQLLNATNNLEMQKSALNALFEAKKTEYNLTIEASKDKIRQSNEETEKVIDNIQKVIKAYEAQLIVLKNSSAQIGEEPYRIAKNEIEVMSAEVEKLQKQIIEGRDRINSYSASQRLINNLSISDFAAKSNTITSSASDTATSSSKQSSSDSYYYSGYDVKAYGSTQLEAALKWLDRAQNLGKISTQQALSHLKQWKTQYAQTADEIYDIDHRIYQAQQKLESDQTAAIKKQLDLVRAAYEKAADDKIALFKKQADAAKEAADKEIKALDDLQKKRNEENEDAKRKAELDKINVQLKYKHLDELSRMELLRRKQDIVNEQAEADFSRQIETKKQTLQGNADAAALQYDKAVGNINSLLERLNYFIAAQTGTVTNQQIVNNNNSRQNFQIVASGISSRQLTSEIVRELYS